MFERLHGSYPSLIVPSRRFLRETDVHVLKQQLPGEEAAASLFATALSGARLDLSPVARIRQRDHATGRSTHSATRELPFPGSRTMRVGRDKAHARENSRCVARSARAVPW